MFKCHDVGTRKHSFYVQRVYLQGLTKICKFESNMAEMLGEQRPFIRPMDPTPLTANLLVTLSAQSPTCVRVHAKGHQTTSLCESQQQDCPWPRTFSDAGPRTTCVRSCRCRGVPGESGMASDVGSDLQGSKSCLWGRLGSAMDCQDGAVGASFSHRRRLC